MQRNYHSTYSPFQNNIELKNQTAFHEAGHASSIYIGNKEKKLPPVFFQIKITKSFSNDSRPYYAKVIDGRLVQNLPIAGLESIQQLTEQQQLLYQNAYEADVINLLAGPLAEAKYISIRDDEMFNINLINTHSLKYYGGCTDVKKANAYLEYFIPSEEQRENKMQELFLSAFRFVEDVEIWKRISKLAHHILQCENEIISCEETIAVIEMNAPSSLKGIV